MTQIVWDAPGEKFYETGVDRGVLYLENGEGVAWNGLVAVTERTTGAESEGVSFDGIKYANLTSAEDFEATLEAFTYPDEFLACDGTQEVSSNLFASEQPRETFGLTYRTKLSNDISEDRAYKIHVIYNALAEPSERSYKTISQNPEAMTFSWDISTVPVNIPQHRPSAHFVIDTKNMLNDSIDSLETILYGSADSAPYLPSPESLISILSSSQMVVIDNGDNTWTAYLPDSDLTYTDAEKSEFQLTSVGATPIDSDEYTLRSV